MYKRLAFMVVVVVLLGCGGPAAGQKDGSCLEGGTCSDPNLRCSLNNICQPCGSEFSVCCDGVASCGESLTCDENNLCSSCGDYWETCCPGDLCGTGMTCAASPFGTGKKCEICGARDNVCCNEEPACQGALVCTVDNRCSRCGDKYLPCCANGTCEGNLVCGPDGTCDECGGWKHVCCPGGECSDADNLCSAENICENCGYLGYVCCPGDPPTCQNGRCSSGICENCGVRYEKCCNGTECDAGLVCAGSDICVECGGISQPPCADGNCRGWMKLFDGECDNPYAHGQSADLADCDLAEPGWETKDTRDWCIWYVAYHQGNAGQCEAIENDYMRGQCKYLQNPADYFIMP